MRAVVILLAACAANKPAPTALPANKNAAQAQPAPLGVRDESGPPTEMKCANITTAISLRTINTSRFDYDLCRVTIDAFDRVTPSPTLGVQRFAISMMLSEIEYDETPDVFRINCRMTVIVSVNNDTQIIEHSKYGELVELRAPTPDTVAKGTHACVEAAIERLVQAEAVPSMARSTTHGP